MSYDVAVKFAPVFTHARFCDREWAADRTLFDKLEFPVFRSNAKLLIDHDENREIGTVNTLYRMEWLDGPWHVASCTLPGEKPSWLQRGCPASFSRKDLHRNESFRVGGTTVDRVYHSWIEEVSILGPGVRPAEPLAEVLLVKRSEPAADEVFYGDGTLVRRFYANAVLGVR
jgi:hypothetical protein